MAKNYMQDVARMLGVELGEEFMIKDPDGHLIDAKFYRITEAGCFCRNNNQNSIGAGKLLGILEGTFQIKKLPWRPKKGEKYYIPSPDFSHTLCDYWDGYQVDFALKEAGMAFKTEKECAAALPELRKKYLGGRKQ